MLAELANLVTNVIFIIFLTTVVDLLLPHSSVKGFVKLIMGLFVIITIVEPVGRVLSLEPLSGWVLASGDSVAEESIMAQSEGYQRYMNEQTMLAYEGKLAQQMKGLVGLVGEITDCQVQVSVLPGQGQGSLGEVEQVTLWLTVADGISDGAAGSKVENLLLNYYGLQENQLEIHWVDGGDENEAR